MKYIHLVTVFIVCFGRVFWHVDNAAGSRLRVYVSPRGADCQRVVKCVFLLFMAAI